VITIRNPTDDVLHWRDRLEGDLRESAQLIQNYLELWRDFCVHLGTFCQFVYAEHRVWCDPVDFLHVQLINQKINIELIDKKQFLFLKDFLFT
jgi:hypothetical protein